MYIFLAYILYYDTTHQDIDHQSNKNLFYSRTSFFVFYFHKKVEFFFSLFKQWHANYLLIIILLNILFFSLSFTIYKYIHLYFVRNEINFYQNYINIPNESFICIKVLYALNEKETNIQLKTIDVQTSSSA